MPTATRDRRIRENPLVGMTLLEVAAADRTRRQLLIMPNVLVLSPIALVPAGGVDRCGPRGV